MTMPSYIRNFYALISKICATSIKHKWKLLLVIALLDAINAISKIAVIFIIAVSVKALAGDHSVIIASVEITYSLQMIWVLGLIIGLVALIGAISAYSSAFYSRQLGRWANQKSMEDIYRILSSKPSQVFNLTFKLPANINILLTQLPLHTGLAYETISRLINPILLLIFSGLVLVYQQPIFTSIAFFSSLVIVPILIKTSASIQKEAKSFYGDQASILGQGVSQTTTLLNSQHGVAGKPEGHLGLKFSSAFLDSFDKNSLANDKTALIMTVLDALLRPILFIVVTSMVFLNDFSADSAITFLGSLAYLLSSSRTVLSYLTNLLRFQPQVDKYHKFLDSFAHITDTDHLVLDKNTASSLNTGDTATVLAKLPITTLNIGEVLPKLAINQTEQMKHIYFASASFRFQSEISIITQLAGEKGIKADKERVFKLCKELGSYECISKLEEKFDTILNEGVWSTLDSSTRAALRTIPLAMKPSGSIIFLDIGIIKGVSPDIAKNIVRSFSHCKLYIVTNGDLLPHIKTDNYIVTLDKTCWGDREWFEKKVAEHEDVLKKSGAQGMLDTTSLF